MTTRMMTSTSPSFPAVAPLAVLLGITVGCGGRTDLETVRRVRPNGESQASAQVEYDHDVVVFVSDDGVAAVHFHRASRHGDVVNYHYRFAPADGAAEVRGDGKVLEKWTTLPTTQPAPRHERNTAYIVVRPYSKDGSVLFVEAGPMRFEWSMGGSSSGWVYFDPQQHELRLARRRDFETLDLKSAVAKMRPMDKTPATLTAAKD